MENKSDLGLGELVPTKTQIFFDLEVRPSGLCDTIGHGTYSKEVIKKGSIIIIGGGRLQRDLAGVPEGKDYVGVFNEDYFMMPLDFDSPTPNWLMNHSCDPNVKIVGGLVVMAKRDIDVGEELTVDYAPVCAGDYEWRMECKCKSSKCRSVITNSDWKNRELFLSLFEEWSPFIQRRGMDNI